MIKNKGDKKVETWEHARSGLTTDIYLRGCRFVAVLLETPFDAPDINIIRHEMADYAEHWITMKWHPIIEVEAGGSSGYRSSGEGVKINYTRFYISQSPAGHFFKVSWEVDEDHRKAEMSSFRTGRGRYGDDRTEKLNLVKLPLTAPLQQDSDEKYWIAYSEAIWVRLKGIDEGIQRLRKAITELISTRKGVELLIAGAGAQLMLAGKSE